jgi:hypothetical protein
VEGELRERESWVERGKRVHFGSGRNAMVCSTRAAVWCVGLLNGHTSEVYARAHVVLGWGVPLVWEGWPNAHDGLWC